MSRDFLADRQRTQSIIGSNSSGPKLKIYSSTESTNNTGGLSTALNNKVTNNLGSDVFLYVDGTIDGKENNTTGSVSVFGGDLVVSGTLYAEKQVIEVDINQTGSLAVSGSITHSGGINIGPAEDSSYTDGLFTDFTNETSVGTAIDRFNEVLKALAPAPAPDMDQFDVDSSNGITAKLSFGSSNDQSSSTPAYLTVDNTTGYPAIDVNDTYQPLTNISNSYRLGIYAKNTEINGTLNEDVSISQYENSTVNYPANSFGNADKGSLKLFLNGVELHTVDLTSFASGNSLNGNNSGFNLSAATAGSFSSGDSFNTFKYRTGTWKINAADQVNGMNYAQVKHVIDSSETVTGYAEWVNDDNSDSLTASSPTLSFVGTGSKYLSGVQYFTGGSSTYTADINNVYKYVYSSSPVTYSSTSTPSNILTLSNSSIPNIDTGNGENHTKVLALSQNNNLTLPSNDRILGGTITVGCVVPHPIKSQLSGASTEATQSQILIDNATDNSANLIDYFDSETYRVVARNYTNSSDMTNSSWDSTQEIISTNTSEYNDGLMTYDSKICSTKFSGLVNSGNFSTLNNGPASNPDYSNGNISTGQKAYYRKIQNTSGGVLRNLSYSLTGDGTLITNSANIGSSNNNFRLFFKLVGITGWLDAASQYTYHNVADNDGGYIGSLDTSITASTSTNYITFGTEELPTNEFVIMKVITNKTWSGNLEQLNVLLNPVGTVNASPVLSSLDNTNTGDTAKLSFGSGLALSGYTNVGSIGGSSSVNVNGLYQTSGSRLGVHDGSTIIQGIMNDSVVASGNSYPNNAWGGGLSNKGNLQLEVNGTVIHTTDLTSFASGNSLTSNSGFVSLSSATVGEDSNNLPDYRYFWRTGSFKVDSAHQRNGWNYARVIHNDGTGARTTNYVEWLNSSFNTTISYSNELMNDSDVSGSGTNYLSGVNYFTQATGKHKATASNVYKYVYDNASDAISYPVTTNSTITSILVEGNGVVNSTINSTTRTLPNLDTNVATAYDENITITSDFNFDISKSIPGSTSTATIACRVRHPITGDIQSSGVTSSSPLIYTVNDTETALVENFSAESYRIQDNAYANQAAVTSESWSSSESLAGSDSGHNTGLQFFDGKLIAPDHNYTNGVNFVSPTSNPDYTSVTGTRTFYRKFQNTTSNSQFGFTLKIKRPSGSNAVSIVPNTTSLSTGNIHVFAKIPTTSNSQSTGFMDVALAFNTGQTGDNDGCLQGTLTSAISSSGEGTSNTVTFGTTFASPNDFIVLKIEADASWNSSLDRIEVEWS